MQKVFFLFLIVGFQIYSVCAQQITISDNKKLDKLTVVDSLKAVNYPELHLPKLYTTNFFDSLPAVLDNSNLIYFRPVFNQAQLECGQASGIGEGFTYEINYERNVNGSLPENQYPTHFAWNFTNSGYSHGVSFFDTWEVLRGFGTPDVSTYGGMYIPSGMARVWVDGYDTYYNAMQNRLDGVYRINLGSEEGIIILKHWLNDHLEGAVDGGVANFYANVPSLNYLASGTPEAGKPVVVQWANYSNHAMTIAGYNDSICYDYNGDGQYTNNIDINGDGAVNMKDWEIGAFRFANNYAGGPAWGDNGFAYMMYRVMAFPNQQGGIWNQAAYVLKTRKTCNPLLTMKVYLKHTSREKIKVSAGISIDTSLIYPQYIKEFPVFNYQGGDYYMQGGSLESHKSLEFGIDISDLLNHQQNGDTARFFLLIDEDDPGNVASGQLLSLSIVDYANGGIETFSSYVNVALTENGLSVFSMVYEPNFSFPQIIGDTLPQATVNQMYQNQLNATAGVSPYFFQFDSDYSEEYSQQPYPAINQQNITTSNNDNGTAVIQLDFDFPFADKVYNEITIHNDGFIYFDENPLNWPYLVSSELFNNYIGKIAPFHADLIFYPSQGHRIWYDGTTSFAHFRWKGVFKNYTSADTVDFGLKIYPDGDMEFFYGEMNIPTGANWKSIINQGNPNQIQYTNINDSSDISSGCHFSMASSFVPDGLLCTDDGLIKGIPTELQAPVPVRIKIKDAANIESKKEMIYSTLGVNNLLIENIEVFANGDNIIEAGEQVQLSMDLRNISNNSFSDVSVSIGSVLPEIQFSDSSEYIGIVNPYDTIGLNNAFTFVLTSHIGNNVEIEFETNIITQNDTFVSNFTLPVYAPDIRIKDVKVNTATGYLEPGISANLKVYIENIGDTKASNLALTFSSNDPYFMIQNPSNSISLLNANHVDSVILQVYVSSLAGVVTDLQVAFLANYSYSSSDMKYLPLQFLGDNFEMGNLNSFGWLFGGDAPWIIDDTIVYEGVYSSRSGYITHNEESSLIYEIDVADEGDLGFYKKVSSEPTYDFLRFYVDGVMLDEWEGNDDWSHESFTLGTGPHVLRWCYEKDYSVSTASDAAWIDYVTLPVIQSLFVSVDEINRDETKSFSVYPNPFHTSCVFESDISTSGKIKIDIFDIQGRHIISIEQKGEQSILWNPKELKPGVYFARFSSAEKAEIIRLVKLGK
ncbi:MAG: T9SS type A sorting domain-containing protein [Bacteroidota bacterium]|nr:T9SS type A sorting domain-containing protein [Bacteroidota bacterium]